jgi:hypothetical protein
MPHKTGKSRIRRENDGSLTGAKLGATINSDAVMQGFYKKRSRVWIWTRIVPQPEDELRMAHVGGN